MPTSAPDPPRGIEASEGVRPDSTASLTADPADIEASFVSTMPPAAVRRCTPWLEQEAKEVARKPTCVSALESP